MVEPPKNHTELLIDSPLDFLVLYGPNIFVYLKFCFFPFPTNITPIIRGYLLGLIEQLNKNFLFSYVG